MIVSDGQILHIREINNIWEEYEQSQTGSVLFTFFQETTVQL